MLPITRPLNTLANLSKNDIEPILIQLSVPDLLNCSLISKQFYKTITIFWQKKSYIDFFPACQPVAPFKQWYELQYVRAKDEAQAALGLPNKVTCFSAGCKDNLNNKALYSFFCMDKPGQLHVLIEKKTLNLAVLYNTVCPPLHSSERVNAILLVGDDAVLAQAAASFRSSEIEEREISAIHLVYALPMPVQDQVYSAFYEILPDAYKDLRHHSKIDIGKHAFHTDLIPLDPNLKALAIENCLMERFLELPQATRDGIYEELSNIVKHSNHYSGWGEHAFHDQHGVSSTREQKIKAIQNYFARPVQSFL